MFREVGMCGPPRLVVALLPVVQHFGFAQVAGVHLCPIVVPFDGLGDYDPMVLAFNLVPIQLTGKDCDVGVGHVALVLE